MELSTEAKVGVVAAVVVAAMAVTIVALKPPAWEIEVEPVELLLKLQPRTSYVCDTHSAVTMNTERGWRRDVRVGIEVSSSHTWDVLAVEYDGTMTLRNTLDAVAIDLDAPMDMGFQYDSSEAGGAVPEGLETLAAFVGQSFKVKVSPRGEVLAVEGIEDIPLPRTVGRPGRAPLAGSTATGFTTEDGVREWFEGALRVYPPRAVAPGDTWEADARVARDLPFEVAQGARWTLRALRSGVAHIEMEREFEVEDDAPGGGAPVSFEVSGSGEGSLRIDRATGCILARRSESECEVSGGTDDIDMDMEMKMTFDMSMREKPPAP
jgi:hypothetical protein